MKPVKWMPTLRFWLIPLLLMPMALHAADDLQSDLLTNSGAVKPSTIVTGQVLKVYSAKDGDSICRAYIVSWKDQEVVVEDPLVQTDYKVGDQIVYLAMNGQYPTDEKPYNLLAFQVILLKCTNSPSKN